MKAVKYYWRIKSIDLLNSNLRDWTVNKFWYLLNRAIQFSLRFRAHPLRLKTKIVPSHGTVLFSYLDYPIFLPDGAINIEGATNIWESREIVRIFLNLGYDVHVVRWDDPSFFPEVRYDIVFDICYNLGLWSDKLNKNTLKILHLTGSDPIFQNAAEISRIEDFIYRKKSKYMPKRMVKNPELARLSIENANACSLIGNETTLLTYPDKYQKKIRLVNVSGSKIDNVIKKPNNYVPKEREFLWYSGSGAVHKGLDLLLDVFNKNQDLRLHIVGKVDHENDFINIYHRELFELSNIEYHGFLNPNSNRFKKIIKKVFCFIMPSCSEGTSTSAITCMQIGLYPIISRNTGVTLPEECGTYLEVLTVEKVEQAIKEAYFLKDNIIQNHIRKVQDYAIGKFSRKKFHESMESYLEDILGIRQPLDYYK